MEVLTGDGASAPLDGAAESGDGAGELRTGVVGFDGRVPVRRESQPAVPRGKLYQDGSLSAVKAGEDVFPASEWADALKQIRELQRMLGKTAMENEIFHEAIEYGLAEKRIAHLPFLPEDGQ